MGEELRDDIVAALDEGGSGEGQGEGLPQAEGTTPPISTPVNGAELAPEPSAPKVGADGRMRDGMGRFVEAPGGVEKPPSTPGSQPAPIAPPPPGLAAPQAAPAVPPPASWTHGSHAHWAAMPAAAQQEVIRRETEFARYFNETAPARQLGERFYQAVQPYMATIQAEGVDPLTAVTNLMQVSTRLRMGTPAEKATTVAQIVKAYAVDLNALDSALAGAAMPASAQGVDPSYVQNAVQQALMPLVQAAQQRRLEQQQEVDAATRSELEQFAADPARPHFAVLRGDMADIIEVSERQGRKMTLADAYERAAMLHPEVSRLIMAQRQGDSAKQLTSAAQRAKAAAVSVNGAAPIGNPGGPEPSTVRESIEAAIDAYSRV